MRAVNRMFIYMVKQITQEMMMLMLAIAPVLVGVFFRIGIPLSESLWIREKTGSLLRDFQLAFGYAYRNVICICWRLGGIGRNR